MMKLPFGWMPGHWGLKGKTREIARAEYELDGYERDAKVAEINYGDEPEVLKKRMLGVKKKHKLIDEYDYETQTAEQSLKGEELELKKLEIDIQHGKLEEHEYAKREATIRGEPYIAVVKSTYDPKQKLQGFEFEFDWNHLWIEELIAGGYSGVSEEAIVQKWFEDLCRTVVMELAEQEPVPFNSNRRHVNRTPREGGTTDYS